MKGNLSDTEIARIKGYKWNGCLTETEQYRNEEWLNNFIKKMKEKNNALSKK